MSEPPLDTQHLSALRRTRSTSDIPRHPDPVHRPESQRHSPSPSEVVDHPHGPRSGAPRRILARAQMEHGRRSPPLAVPLEHDETHTVESHASRDDDVEDSSVHEPEAPRSLYQKVMFSVGYGRGASRERRSLIGLILNLASGSAQIIIATVILALSGTRFKSPTQPDLTEWQACSRPLGPWAFVILGFMVFVVAPVVFLFWNIVLICMGRHPLQTRNTIKPDIGKLPRSIVESIPLVMYIPPPPDNMPQQQTLSPQPPSSPPKPALPDHKKRFKFIRRLTSTNSVKNGKDSDTAEAKDVQKADEPQTWEEHWEKGEYPFVVLEENRAACAICLLDFAEPKRIWGQSKPGNAKAEDSDGPTSLDAPTSAAHMITSTVADAGPNAESDNTLKLADAGEGSQPLRLLACGHVFHVSLPKLDTRDNSQ
ncbi:hypothetical protein C0991_005263 [Blastosporella zonata]|nr:hypothetical protein C0991_005263 [Blastosporella zonata]